MPPAPFSMEQTLLGAGKTPTKPIYTGSRSSSRSRSGNGVDRIYRNPTRVDMYSQSLVLSCIHVLLKHILSTCGMA